MSEAVSFNSNKKVAIIGLGYVGLPLALRAATKYEVVAFDINSERIEQLLIGTDVTCEVDSVQLITATRLHFTSNLLECADAALYIVTVPTPVNDLKQPDLTAIRKACESVASVLSSGDIVVFESTVYPGCTEEVCVPILEEFSGLKLNRDFFCGYSPERINPGDKEHSIDKIVKVTSGSTDLSANIINDFYESIIPAGTHKAESIKVAEAAKVIENTQRDLNIALMNELSLIFKRMDIDTNAVLAAAKTKWNFLPFQPGLVGGHCIGVDPYYLTHKAQSLGYQPEVILAGRQINDSMPKYIATELIQRLEKPASAEVLVLGITFKENCPDTRNSKVKELVESLSEAVAKVDIYDPWISCEESASESSACVLNSLSSSYKYNALILAVPHEDFISLGADYFRSLLLPGGVFFDVRGVFPVSDTDFRL